MTTHSLKIVSLRDLLAYCSCGDWAYAHPTTTDETDQQLREKADREYLRHCAQHCVQAIVNW